MTPRIRGLHHVTATVDEAQTDVDFCRGLLGLRLVKKTVNFDNHNVYHFYYGNTTGQPGTIWTTFPYRGHGVRPGLKGAGQVVDTAFSVPVGSLEFWRNRLRKAGQAFSDAAARFGQPVIALNDPSGLRFELIADDRDTRDGWPGVVASDVAIRGLHSVTMMVRAAKPSIDFLTNVLGYSVLRSDGPRTRVCAMGDVPGHLIDIVEDPAAPAAVNGIGTVHHVAMAIDTADEQVRLREELVRIGVGVTEIRDRTYFQSIYFREPGGVLFEVATATPGFMVDEDASSLGSALKLPPWEEVHRDSIEGHLDVIAEPTTLH
jgi:glyoxalase family protein